VSSGSGEVDYSLAQGDKRGSTCLLLSQLQGPQVPGTPLLVPETLSMGQHPSSESLSTDCILLGSRALPQVTTSDKAQVVITGD
jgi:hypothetical protein